MSSRYEIITGIETPKPEKPKPKRKPPEKHSLVIFESNEPPVAAMMRAAKRFKDPIVVLSDKMGNILSSEARETAGSSEVTAMTSRSIQNVKGAVWVILDCKLVLPEIMFQAKGYQAILLWLKPYNSGYGYRRDGRGPKDMGKNKVELDGMFWHKRVIVEREKKPTRYRKMPQWSRK